MLGWIGNVFIVIALFRLGKPTRTAFVLGAIGEALWFAESLRIREWSLAAMCALLFAIYLVNLFRFKPLDSHV